MGRGHTGQRANRSNQTQGKSTGGPRGSKGKRAAARLLKGRPQPILPEKLTRELAGTKNASEPTGETNIIGGSLADMGESDDSHSSEYDKRPTGPGNSTRVYVAGGHTRALGGGGLFGISLRKQERKAAATAAKQRNAQRFINSKAIRNAATANPPSFPAKQQPADRDPTDGPRLARSSSEGSHKQRGRAAVRPDANVASRKRKAIDNKNEKFEAFLGDLVQSSGGDKAIAAEKAHYRQLAKKLKIKGDRVSRNDDGLDAFTAGLTTAAMLSDTDDEAEGHMQTSSEGNYSGSDDEDEATSSSDESYVSMPQSEAHSGSDDEHSLSDGSLSDDSLMDNSLSDQSDQAEPYETAGSGGTSESDVAQADPRVATETRDTVSRNSGTKQKNKPAAGLATSGAYVPPALRAKADAGQGGDARLLQQVRGLLNRLAESNMQGIAAQVVDLMDQDGRRVVSDNVTAELLSAVTEGPRASDAFAAVATAFIFGVSALANAQEVAARFLEALAVDLEVARSRNASLACTNLTMVAVHSYLCGLVPPSLLFGLLHHLSDRFQEQDVAMMSVALRAAGLHLRNADPAAMRDFLVEVHSRAAAASAAGTMTTRAEVMLSLLMDIKNNRLRGGGSSNVVLTGGTTQWLKAVNASAVALHGLSWQKLLAPNKKGLWWMPAVGDALPAVKAGNLSEGIQDERLLQLASAARMNTDTRRTVFCIVMGSEDAADAFERLLRLSLKGEAARELVRVPLECALQEAAWNPYYCHLLARLASSDTSHLVTLQYCLWDQFKTVEAGEARRTAQLARLTGALISDRTLPLSALKVVHFDGTMVTRETVFWCLMFQHVLLSCSSKDSVTAIFTRLVGNAAGKPLAKDLAVWLQRTFAPWIARRPNAKDPQQAAQFSQRLDIAVSVLTPPTT